MKDLDKFLSDIDDIDFRQTELRLQLGRTLRDIELNYELTLAQAAKRLELKPLEYLRWRSGAVNFTITQIAKINVLLGDLIREKALEKDLIKIKLDEEKKK